MDMLLQQPQFVSVLTYRHIHGAWQQQAVTARLCEARQQQGACTYHVLTLGKEDNAAGHAEWLHACAGVFMAWLHAFKQA